MWKTSFAFSLSLSMNCRNVATINSLEEFLDSIHTQLDELWRLPQNYPQNRMIDLMDIICRFESENISRIFSNVKYCTLSLSLTVFYFARFRTLCNHSTDNNSNLAHYSLTRLPFFSLLFIRMFSTECNGILFGSTQWNWWCLGCQVVACISNPQRYYRCDWVMDSSMWFVNTFILAEL